MTARKTPYDTSPAMCFPSQPSRECRSCSRMRRSTLLPAKVVRIDASVIPHGADGCPMRPTASAQGASFFVPDALQLVAQCGRSNVAQPRSQEP
jgi:hypothetical protein